MRSYKTHANQYSRPDFRPLWLLISIMSLSAYLNYRFQPLQATLSPCPDTGCVMLQVRKVEAAEPIKQPQTVEEKIRAMFPEDPDMAVHVAFCESSLNPNAKSKGSTASGLFQIIRGTWKGYKCGDNPFDPDQNIACARKIYLRNGWGSTASWDASSNCWGK